MQADAPSISAEIRSASIARSPAGPAATRSTTRAFATSTSATHQGAANGARASRTQPRNDARDAWERSHERRTDAIARRTEARSVLRGLREVGEGIAQVQSLCRSGRHSYHRLG